MNRSTELWEGVKLTTTRLFTQNVFPYEIKITYEWLTELEIGVNHNEDRTFFLEGNDDPTSDHGSPDRGSRDPARSLDPARRPVPPSTENSLGR